MKPSRFLFLVRLAGAIAGMALAVILSGCGRKLPLDQVVDASSDFKLMMWKAQVAGDFTRQEWQDFDAAVQEIKYGIMIAGEASGSAGVKTATLQKLDGLSVRDVLKMGLGRKLERLVRERDEFAGYIDHNYELRVQAGDEASADYLQTLREHQERRVDLLNGQIRVTTEILLRRGIMLEEQSVQARRPAASAPF